MPNATLPILLKNQKILLIGGGSVALQKARVLFDNDIAFSIIAKEVKEELYGLCDAIVQKSFKRRDIGTHFIIIDASNNPKVSKKLLKHKKKHPCLLNVVDKPKLCDFYFMALTKNRPLQIAVSSNGASPTAAKFFRDACEELIPEDIDAYLAQKQRERERGFIDAKATHQELLSKRAKVFLIGCGLGDAKLLTIEAYEAMQEADVVLYDHLITPEVMDLVPQKTQRVYVGKQKGFHSKSQEEINALILEYAQQGLKVARLKSGDPFVFGRGAEELQMLIAQGVETKVIAGITSCTSAPLLANIPVTARGYANGFSVVSAHLRGDRINVEWVELLKRPKHTVVVLMGVSRIGDIVNEAKRLDIAGDMPVAIVSKASQSDQQATYTRLDALMDFERKVPRPAILVFGDVVNLSKILRKVQ